MRTLLALSVAVFAGCAPEWGAVEGNVLTAELNMPHGSDYVLAVFVDGAKHDGIILNR